MPHPCWAALPFSASLQKIQSCEEAIGLSIHCRLVLSFAKPSNGSSMPHPCWAALSFSASLQKIQSCKEAIGLSINCRLVLSFAKPGNGGLILLHKAYVGLNTIQYRFISGNTVAMMPNIIQSFSSCQYSSGTFC